MSREVKNLPESGLFGAPTRKVECENGIFGKGGNYEIESKVKKFSGKKR